MTMNRNANVAIALVTLFGCGLVAAAEKDRTPMDVGKGRAPATNLAGRVEVRISSSSASIANEFLSWEMSLAENRPRTISIRNRRMGQTAPIEGDDFVLEFADGSRVASNEFTLEKAIEETTEDGGKKIVLHLARGNLRLLLVTEMHPGQWWATRHLEILGGAGELAAVTLAQWQCGKTSGPSSAGKILDSLGFPNESGQPVYVDDLFLAIVHPGAQNFIRDGGLSCRLPAYDQLGASQMIRTRNLVVGAGEKDAVRRAFLGYIDATRAVPSRMIFLVNDWYWKDKSRPLEAVKALAAVKQQTGVPVDSFTLDDGWDFDWDTTTGLWGQLDRKRFGGDLKTMLAAGAPANIGLSLWFGPIGGYGVRKKRIEFARTAGFEIYGDKLCLTGPRYRKHVIESFSRWAAQGMDYIKVDGFWPECPQSDHGHPVGPRGAIAQMDALIEVFAAWHKARPDLVIGYTSGSNPSPFWLQHCDYVWRAGRDDSHAGAGEPFDRNNTYLDACLQAHRQTEMPTSAFVTFDIVQGRTTGSSKEAFERGAWWLAARTSLHHDWYVQPSDLSAEEWATLARAAKWAKGHEKVFRWSRMIGGDPGKGEVYGFAAFDGGAGTLALRNPTDKAQTFEASLADALDLPAATRSRSLRLRSVYGATQSLEGDHAATARLRVQLPPLAIAVFEVETVGE